MVCNRCILVVKQELERLKLIPVQVSMGEAELKKPATEKQLKELDGRLRELGFEILDDQKQRQIEKIKSLLIKIVQSGQVEEHFSITNHLSKALHKDYSYISRLFSEVEGMTIEQFFILQKVEKVKEWIAYDELTLSEIAWKLGYSSLSHLSSQFKKVTGLNPSHFKKLGLHDRKSLENVRSEG